jgi:predicted membrane channel-forming protein YqfA (hemolysin III family)
LNNQLKIVAPNFKDADSILSYITIIPLMINLASAAFCLGCSAAFHLFYVKSPIFLNVLARLDYGGISVLIFGSALPIMYYSFACDPELI